MSVKKFRVWDKKEGYMKTSPQAVASVLQKVILGAPDKNDYVVMQCTGFKDAKGRDVYEGDIIEFEDEMRSRYYIGFDKDGCFALYDRLGVLVEYSTDLFDGFEKDFFVIGNIYENPKLLKGVKIL